MIVLLSEIVTAIIIFGLPFYGSWLYYVVTGDFLRF